MSAVHPQQDTLMTRIGPVPDDPTQRFTIPYGLVGLPQFTSFVLYSKTQGPLKWLCSRQANGWTFPVLEPTVMWPEYRPPVPKELLALWSCTPADLSFLSILVIVPNQQKMRTNLQAPIAVHGGLRQAVQLVLSDPCYPMAHYLLADEQSRVRACWS